MYIKSGKRGRPIKIDIEQSINYIYEQTPTAVKRLQEIYKRSKGMRSHDIFGTRTSAPKWLSESLDTLEAALHGRNISYGEVKEIKQTLTTLKQLSSKQARVYDRAISEQLMQAYEKELKEASRNVGKFEKRVFEKIEQSIKKLSPRTRQKTLTGRGYQSPKRVARYKRIREWAISDSGKSNMTYNEAYAYLIERRLEDGLGVGDLEEIF